MRTVPLRARKLDVIFVAFFLLNLLFVTYVVDIEQIIIIDVNHFSYPAWPPHALVDLFHSYGRAHDPLLMARPPFWRMTIWIDVILFGPFYACATYAFIRGREWIRVPALIWSGMMLSNVLIILFDEKYGVTPAPNFLQAVGANLAWLVLPLLMIWRMRRDHPFSQPVAAGPVPGSA